MRSRRSFASRRLRRGVAAAFFAAAVAVVAYMILLPGKSFTGPLPPLTAEEADSAARLKTHVTAVATREHNMFTPEALEEAARYIESQLASFGYTVQTQPYTVNGATVRNIEAELRGATEELIVIGAHYDSVSGSPGANDNGSGVAATLELARRFASQRFERTLRFVLFVNEEPPFFLTGDMGSRHYAARSQTRGERIAAMFSLETIGYYSDAPRSQHYPPPLAMLYPDTANFIAFVSNIGSRALLRDAIGAFRRHAKFPSEGVAAPAVIPGVDWSDHASFWDAGYPGLMITDTAPYRYPHYHLASDTPDKVDYERLARVASGLAAMLSDLARPAAPR